jgi:tetratricopeptide (TPR) repeat protein
MLAAIVWLIVRFWKKGNRIWFFAFGVFFLNLAPSSGILAPVNALIYEHWLYFGIFGIAALAGYYLDKLLEIVSDKATMRRIVVGALIVYFAFLGVASAKRNLAWTDPKEFYIDILRYSPDSVRINNNLGNLYNQEGDLETARLYYEKSIESEDIFAQPHYNIGVILMNAGDFEGAKREYLRAIELNPNFHFAYQNLAFVHVQQNNLVAATENMETLLTLRSSDPAVYYNLAIIYAARGLTQKAIDTATQGLEYANEDQRAIIEAFLTNLE